MKARTFAAPVSGTIFSYSWQLSIDDAASAISAYQEFAVSADIPRELGIQAVLSRGEADSTVGFGLSGGWYGAVDNLDATLQPLLDGIGFAPRSSSRDPGDYLYSAENLAGGSLDTSAPGGTDTFYAKSLVTPKDSPISSEAIRAFVSTLATEGFQVDLVSSYPSPWEMPVTEVEVDRAGGSSKWTSLATPTRPLALPLRMILCSLTETHSSPSSFMDQVGTMYPHSQMQASPSSIVRHLSISCWFCAANAGPFLDAVESITQNMPADWGQG